MSRSPRNEVLVGALLLVAGAVFVWLAIEIGAMQGFEDTVSVSVRFDDAAGLVPDSAVKVAGVAVGAVEDIQVDHDVAVATVRLKSSAALRSDVRAEIRSRSLLGEKYLSLTPKSKDAPLLKDGDSIDDVRGSMELDQIITTFGPLVAGIDPDDVAKIVEATAAMADGLKDDVPATAEAAKRLIVRLEELGELVPLLKAEVPALVADVRRLAASLEGTAGKADGLVDDLSGVAKDVDTALDEVPAVVSSARRIAEGLEPGADDMGRALEQSDELVKRLDALAKRLEGLDEETIRHLLREEGVLVRVRPLSREPKP